jgi:hypothetical protein
MYVYYRKKTVVLKPLALHIGPGRRAGQSDSCPGSERDVAGIVVNMVLVNLGGFALAKEFYQKKKFMGVFDTRLQKFSPALP